MREILHFSPKLYLCSLFFHNRSIILKFEGKLLKMKLPNFKRILASCFFISISLLFMQCEQDELDGDELIQLPLSKDAVYLDDNGVTVKAKEGAEIGDTGEINGVVYTIISEEDLRLKVFDFEEDIYGKDLEVIPLSQLRQEKKFSGMEELQNQIKKDLESASNYLSEHELLTVE